MNKADVGTAKEKDLFSRSPFLEMPMMFITSDEEVGQGSWAVFWFMFLGFSFLVSDYTLHSQHIVGATPFVDSGWPHLLKWAQKLQSGWLTHIVDQQTCWCVWRNCTVQFVVSIVLRVTICWFGSILESFCTADPFRWQHGVTLSPFVDSDLSSNQHSVRWTHLVDKTLFCYYSIY